MGAEEWGHVKHRREGQHRDRLVFLWDQGAQLLSGGKVDLG